jgi:Cell Wall Hydrolase
MVASRNRSEGGLKAPFGLGVLMLLLLPGEVGYQDLAALIARQPPLVERTQKAAFASSFGTIHAAKLDMPRPVGATISQSYGYALAGLDSNSADVTGSIRQHVLGEAMLARPPAGPLIDRSRKGDYGGASKSDRVVGLKGDRLKPNAPASAMRDDDPERNAQERASSLARQQVPPPPVAPSAEVTQVDDAGKAGDGEPAGRSVVGLASADMDPALRAARLYFSIDSMGQKLGAIEPWAPGEEPKFDDATDIKLAALPREALPEPYDPIIDVPVDRADLPPLPADPRIVIKGDAKGGQSIASKGEVTGEDKRPMSPAERLGLDEQGRAKAEKCLTEVIYFEARGEAVHGQMAVAQVVLNRTFSGKYPNTVCGVVYQNAHRHLACQFTFACDGIRDVIREPDMWERAKVIAAEMLDGKLWLPEVGKATHYHAYWVRPGWVREMTKLQKLGVHTFYRPRAWGDGADAPEWGDVSATAESTKKLVEAAKKL